MQDMYISENISEECPYRFFGYLLFFFFACCVDLMISVGIVYILLETGAASATDLGYFFIIQFFFLAFFLVVAGLKHEFNIRFPSRVEAEEAAQQLHIAIL